MFYNIDTRILSHHRLSQKTFTSFRRKPLGRQTSGRLKRRLVDLSTVVSTFIDQTFCQPSVRRPNDKVISVSKNVGRPNVSRQNDKVVCHDCVYQTMFRPNVCQPNVCRPNVCRPNVCRRNVCRPNVCRPNICRPNDAEPKQL